MFTIRFFKQVRGPLKIHIKTCTIVHEGKAIWTIPVLIPIFLAEIYS